MNVWSSGYGTCAYGPGTCLCFDGYEGEDCGTVHPVPIQHKQKKSSTVTCVADNLYTYIPQSYPANISIEMRVATDPLTRAPAALLAATTHQA